MMVYIEPSRKHIILKTVLRMIIKKFGIQLINEKIAEIFTEESEALRDYSFDDLAEAYDNINKDLKFKDTIKKVRL